MRNKFSLIKSTDKMKQERIEHVQIGHEEHSECSFMIDRNASHKSEVESDTTHRHDFHAIYWIHEGSGEHIIDFESYEIRPGMFFYVRPDQVHFFHAPEEIRLSALQFSEEFLLSAKLSDHSAWRGIVTSKLLTEEEAAVVGKWFDIIGEECTRHASSNNLILQLEVSTFMEELVRMSQSLHGSDIQPETVRKYRQLIEQNYRRWHQVAEYADALGVSANYLNVLTVKHLDQTALSLIHSRLSLEIKRQLLTSDRDIAEIAYMLGFNEMSYFTRFFKRMNGKTPSEFKIQMNEMYHFPK